MIIVDSYKYREYLLERFPATVAYSLRKLRSGQTIAIRVRRSSDNAEQDIGFVGNELDTASLLSFCGVGDGFVTTWYDQIGNGCNVIQATQANQPRIVVNRVLQTLNGKPVINAVLPSNLINNSPNINYSNHLILSVMALTAIGEDWFGTGGVDNGDVLLMNYSGTSPPNSYRGHFFPRVIDFDVSTSVNTQYLFEQETSTAHNTYKIYRNGIADSATAAAAPTLVIPPVLNLGNRNGGPSSGRYYQEFIIYNTDQIANRTTIESNINTHYTIY